MSSFFQKSWSTARVFRATAALGLGDEVWAGRESGVKRCHDRFSSAGRGEEDEDGSGRGEVRW